MRRRPYPGLAYAVLTCGGRTRPRCHPCDRPHMIDPARLGPLLRERREVRGWSLRRAADEIGVAFNTIARVEGGHLPDLDNYRKIVAWLGGGSDESTEARPDTLEAITTHLSHDPSLRPGDAQRIARMVRDMYEALARPQQVGAVAGPPAGRP